MIGAPDAEVRPRDTALLVSSMTADGHSVDEAQEDCLALARPKASAAEQRRLDCSRAVVAAPRLDAESAGDLDGASERGSQLAPKFLSR